ncbi:hypothetical protein Tco_1250340 [Tanacetum coccineum]
MAKDIQLGTLWYQEDEEVHEKTSADTEVLLEKETLTELVEDVGSGGKKKKDKGKAIMIESEPPKKIKKRDQVQISLDAELAQRFHEEEHARFVAVQELIRLQQEQQEKTNFETTLEFEKQLDKREEVVAKAHEINWNDLSVLREVTS